MRPQSPLDNDEAGVTMDARTGYGRVAVSDSLRLRAAAVSNEVIACGSENRRDFRSKFAVGDIEAAMLFADTNFDCLRDAEEKLVSEFDWNSTATH